MFTVTNTTSLYFWHTTATLLMHPVGRSINSDWFVNSFMKVLYEKFFLFSQNFWWPKDDYKNFLMDNHFYELVRIDRSSHRVWWFTMKYQRESKWSSISLFLCHLPIAGVIYCPMQFAVIVHRSQTVRANDHFEIPTFPYLEYHAFHYERSYLF